MRWLRPHVLMMAASRNLGDKASSTSFELQIPAQCLSGYGVRWQQCPLESVSETCGEELGFHEGGELLLEFNA